MNTTSSYLDLFKGINFRRTIATIGVYLIQAMLAPLVGQIVYFLEQAGLSAADSFDFVMGEYSLAILGVFLTFFLTQHFAQRTLLLFGISFMCLGTYLSAFLGLINLKVHSNVAYSIGRILLVQYFFYSCTVGTTPYTVVTELPSHYLRAKSVAAARAMYNVVSPVNGQLTPHMIQRPRGTGAPKLGFITSLIGAYIQRSRSNIHSKCKAVRE